VDWKEFIASLIGSTAWPLAVTILLIAFRSVIKQLTLEGVRKWKVGATGIEVEYWDKERTNVKESIEQQSSQGIEDLESQSGGLLVDELASLAKSRPSAVVIEAFIKIEVRLREILGNAGNTPSEEISRMPARKLVLVCLDQNLITPESANSIEGLSVMRNLAVHGKAQELEVVRALEFLHLADAVLFTLRPKGS